MMFIPLRFWYKTGMLQFAFAILLIFTVNVSAGSPPEIPSPESFLGYRVGTDFKLAPWDSIVMYFDKLDSASERIRVRRLGTTTEGNPFLLVEISSAETMHHIEEYKNYQHKLADPRLVTSFQEEKMLIARSKPVVLLNCQIHSTEVASGQMAMELAYELASLQTAEIREILEKTIVLLIPSTNPDGQKLVAEYYKKTLGTPWEGGRLPFLYHKYAGHDNNRDWFMLNLKETRLVTRLLYKEWFPTVVWDIHQTRRNSYRLFLPPFYNPKNPNTHPLIERMLHVVGGQMAQALTARGMTGVVQEVSYDNYWAGGFRTTPQRHNILGLLSEAASVRMASPVFLRRDQLVGGGRGMPAYTMTVNFPDPWPGGWWRLRDIVDYEKTAALALLTYVARFHDLLQRNYLLMGRDAIKKGQSEPPFAWVVPPNQRDPGSMYQMLWRLHATGIEVWQAAEPFRADDVAYPAGTFILYSAQPYRPHLMDMMEIQHYPVPPQPRGCPLEAPYDVAGWTFPLLMGVRYAAVQHPFTCETRQLETIPFPRSHIQGNDSIYLLIPTANEQFRLENRLFRANIPVQLYTGAVPWTLDGEPVPPGALIVHATASELRPLLDSLALSLRAISPPPVRLRQAFRTLREPRLAVFQPWTASIDEGWMRYVLDDFQYRYQVIHNSDVRAGALNRRFDCIILPSVRTSSIVEGRKEGTTFPEYTGGIGREGIRHLQEFVEAGGTLICNDKSTALVLEYFNVPVEDALQGLSREEFFCSGSILRLQMNPSHPLGYGMPEWFSGYFNRSRAFRLKEGEATTGVPVQVSVVARYAPELVLESGWLKGEKYLAGQPAILELHYGKGYIELLGIHVQHRAQTHGTFRILFNAIQRSVLVE